MTGKIQATHLERRAVIYLRQSTLRQVHDNHESTVRQYALGQRATELGWPPERVEIVDDDLGRSGTTTRTCLPRCLARNRQLREVTQRSWDPAQPIGHQLHRSPRRGRADPTSSRGEPAAAVEVRTTAG
jgi:DNA invertase Pin-like site-specific DNA recombinase